MKKLTIAAIAQLSIFGLLMSCADSSTSPSTNTSMVGTWRSVTIDSISVLDDTGGIIGNTQVADTYTISFVEGGTLQTTIKHEFNPQIASATNNESTYTGTWSTSGDTLFRDMYPGSLGSNDTNRYLVSGSQMTLSSLKSNYSEVYTRIE